MEDTKKIEKILEALDKAATNDSNVEWDDAAPDTEGNFGKVSDTGNHEMKIDDFKKVTDGGKKKMETKPAFPKVKGDGEKGGANSNAKEHGQKDPYNGIADAKTKIKEAIVKIDKSNKFVESKLDEEKRKKVVGLREAIENLTGKKVVYKKG